MSAPALATIADALHWAQQQGLARLDAQQLLAHLLQRPRTWLIAHDDQPLPPAAAERYRTLVARRGDDEPLAYLVGEKEFHGLTLSVSPAVLVPRPDTETLVDWALRLLDTDFASVAQPQVLDLGTGSGAIALAVKHRCPRAEVHALDASPQALQVAEANARRLGLAVNFHRGDWWQGVSLPPLQLALSNPPYVAEHDPHLQALRHEPTMALTPGGDGLVAIDALIAGAPAHLAAHAWLLIEHGHDQGGAVRERLVAAGFAGVVTQRDMAGQERCTGGCWPGPKGERAHSKI